MFKVRVRNFQSIKDATVKVDGLTVITGANNSGKTALMRAIRGVFENSPFGSLLRKGEDRITVDLEFEDGRTVTWEKGPKDNSYTIDGYKLAGVGRGAPDELKELGIHPIVAANNTVWPQVANQFDGTIFLLNRSGAVLAEALSDVEKVGKLTSALRLSEKDRKSISSELKVRRKDLKEQEETVSLYDGFENLEDQVEDLLKQKETLSKQLAEYEKVKGLYERLKGSQRAVMAFDGFQSDILPEKERIQKINRAYNLCVRLQTSKEKAESTYAKYKDFQELELPKEEKVLKTVSAIKQVSKFSEQLAGKQQICAKYSGFLVPDLPSEKNFQQSMNHKELARSLYSKLMKAEESSKEFSGLAHNLKEKQVKVLSLVDELLGDLGECPVCKKPHDGGC